MMTFGIFFVAVSLSFLCLFYFWCGDVFEGRAVNRSNAFFIGIGSCLICSAIGMSLFGYWRTEYLKNYAFKIVRDNSTDIKEILAAPFSDEVKEKAFWELCVKNEKQDE